MQETAALLTPAHNYAVEQLPGRKFPGVVFQGDSLAIFASEISEKSALLADGNMEALGNFVESLNERFDAILASYEVVCERNGIALPYAKG